MQRHIGLDALDDNFSQRVTNASECGVAIVAVSDQLADHRVIERRHLVAAVDMAVGANTGSTGGMPERDEPGRRHKGFRVFRVDAALDCMALYLDVFLPDVEFLAARDEQLLADDIDARDHLGHRVLHLQAGVHLDEIEFAVLVQEFEGAGAAIADFQAGVDAARADRLPLLLGYAGGRSFLDDLLVAALHRAVAFAEMYGITLAVSKHLEFHVPWVFEEFLHVHNVVVERGASFGLGDRNGGYERCLRVHDAHAPATTATRGLDNDRVADVAREAKVFVVIVAERSVGSRHAGDTGFLHCFDCRYLVAHKPDRVRGRSDENESRRFAALCKIGVFREEAVTRVYAHCIRYFGGADDRRHVQVTFHRGRGTDTHGLVGQQNVLEIIVRTRVHGDGLDIEFPAGAQDTQRNFAAVGDDDFIEHTIAAL